MTVGPSGGVWGCGPDGATGPQEETSDWVWNLPPGVPTPVIPPDQAMSRARFELGRLLFYDTRLSLDGSQSCASCHVQSLAFADGLDRPVGVTGEVHPRSSMSLANVGWVGRLTWANPLLDRLEFQALIPLFGDNPVEMGMGGREDELLARLAADPDYPAHFDEAWGEGSLTVATVTRSLAVFQRGLVSLNSPWDRYMAGDVGAVPPEAVAGAELFFGERLECFHCHGGLFFSDTIRHDRDPDGTTQFHNTGLYNLDAQGSYPWPNTGVHEITGRLEDMGRFRAPSLRNIAVTAPYMHDGSIATLDEVIDHYAAGGRTIEEGPNAGVGRDNPLKSHFVTGFTLDDAERAALLAFLNALTDEDFLTDPAYSDPWEGRRDQLRLPR